ncbi:MAG: tetratricopeptide repeat protein [Victivallales bacterium]
MRFLPSRGKLFPVFLFPLLAASLARILVSYELQDSPLRYYHTIDGLDMKWIVDAGESFYNGTGFFNIYSALVALSYHLNGQTHQVEFIVALQFLCGCISALLVTYIVLKTSGSKVSAVLAGCAAGLYLPEMIYETQILKESIYLTLACASFALLIKSTRKKFSIPLALSAGIFAFIPALLRLPGAFAGAVISLIFGLLLFRKFKKGLICKRRALLIISVYLAGALPVLSVFTGVCLRNGVSAFSKWTSYYMQKGAEPMSSTMNITQVPETEKTSIPVRYLTKVRDIFKSFEICNNINYYFVKNQLGAAGYLEGPLLLLPFGICGLVLMLLRRRFMRKEGIYFAFLLAYGLPILAFVPLARYRLVLLPVFCAGAAYFIMYFARTIFRDFRNRSLYKSGILALLYIVVLYWSIPENIPVRSEDFLVHGLAISAGRKNTDEVEKYFLKAYEMNPDSRSVVLYFSGELTRKGKYTESEAVLRNYLGNHPDDPKCMINLAVLYNTMVRPDLAEKVILSMKTPEDPRGKTFYYYNLGVSYMLQGRKAEADSCFQKALETADGQKAQLLRKAIEFNKHNKRP